MTTIEKLRANIPHMKEWGQFAAVELCEQAAAELEALQREVQREVAALNHSASVNCLEWQDWERWAKEVCQDFKLPFDDHKVGMRAAITRWMIDGNTLRTQNRTLREACVRFVAWYHVDPFKGDDPFNGSKHWQELPDIIRQAEQALAQSPEGKL